jgi:hypothetical protein
VAIHDIPLAQIFALNACHAWGEGLEIADANYQDRDYLEELSRIVAARAGA